MIFSYRIPSATSRFRNHSHPVRFARFAREPIDITTTGDASVIARDSSIVHGDQEVVPSICDSGSDDTLATLENGVAYQPEGLLELRMSAPFICEPPEVHIC
jgi:hypothetical protein